MATSKPTRLTQLVLGASVITATVMGGYKLYISGNQYVSGNVGFTGTASGTALNIYGSGATTDLRTSKTTGNVGIGLLSTDLPETKLEVRGTASGLTLKGGGGRTTIDTNIVTRGYASGAFLTATPQSGTQALVLFGGAKGVHYCMFDTDGVGYTECHANNGTLTCAIASAQYCP